MINPSCQFGNVIRDESGGEIYNEALVMYDIALMVQEELRADGRVDAFISREARDQPTTLREETELTRGLACEVLVALHSDDTGTGEPGGGTWAFYADEGESKRLAESVHAYLLEAIRRFHPEVRFLGVRTHWKRLWVLHESGCPACLVEILFHSNPTEREMLKDPDRQRVMAQAIAKGVLSYLGLA